MRNRYSVFIFIGISLSILISLFGCGGGGGSSTPPPSPSIQALLFSFPTGSVPPSNFKNALVSVIDGSSGTSISNATVAINNVMLNYNYLPTHQAYEGNVTVNPGDSVTLSVTVGGHTYTASGTQFTTYPTILSPAPGTTFTASNSNMVSWSPGSPLINAAYLLGVLDAADPIGSEAYLYALQAGTNYYSIPAGNLTAGSRVLLVGITTPVQIPNADSNSYFIFGGYNYVPITVSGSSSGTLTSITVTPANPSIAVGATQQFIATGHYSDGSTQDLTNQVTWMSSDIAKATINSTGLSYGVAIGSSTITATSGSISGWTSLTINNDQTVSLATNDIIYDPTRGKIYASVPGRAGSLGNTIASIDPISGATVTSVYVGSEPGKLALSGDGQFLYVALNGVAAVRRVTLDTMTPDIQFSLGSDSFFGPRYAEDLVVLPGYPHSVAVSTKYLGVSPRFAGVAIYDDGVQRSVTVPGFSGTGHCINAITASATASTLYGYNNETTEYGFYRMNINASGISIADETSSLITGFGVDIAFGGGLVYATTGQVVDPSGTTPVLTGTFPGVSYAKAVTPDTVLGKTFFLFDGSPYTVSAYDQMTFRSLGSFTVQGNSGTSSSLIRWGTNGLAFRTSADQIFLIKSSLVQ